MPTDVNNLTPATVDRVVRDVLAELGGRSVGGNGAAAALPGKPAVAPGKTAVAPGELVIDDAVVTLASLERRLDGVSRVVASKTSIVTPAVKDELRDRGIALVRSAHAGAGAAMSKKKLLFAADEHCDTDTIDRSLQQMSVHVEKFVCGDLAGTVDALIRQVVQGGVAAVIATAQPATAVCLANRHTGVRAVSAHGIDQLERAVAEVGANVLVLDTVGTSTHALRTAVRRFAELAPRCCPSDLAARLG